jgi:hypothetical protein
VQFDELIGALIACHCASGHSSWRQRPLWSAG